MGCTQLIYNTRHTFPEVYISQVLLMNIPIWSLDECWMDLRNAKCEAWNNKIIFQIRNSQLG